MDHDNSKLRLPIHLSIEDPSGAVPSGTQGFPTGFIWDRRLQEPRTEGAFVRPWSCTRWVSSASCFLGQGCIYDISTVDYGLITGGTLGAYVLFLASSACLNGKAVATSQGGTHRAPRSSAGSALTRVVLGTSAELHAVRKFQILFLHSAGAPSVGGRPASRISAGRTSRHQLRGEVFTSALLSVLDSRMRAPVGQDPKDNDIHFFPLSTVRTHLCSPFSLCRRNAVCARWRRFIVDTRKHLERMCSVRNAPLSFTHFAVQPPNGLRSVRVPFVDK